MIDWSQCFSCGVFCIAVWAFFQPQAPLIRWLMAIEMMILSATTEILIIGARYDLSVPAQVIALFWMTFAAVELAVGLAFVRRLADQGQSLLLNGESDHAQEMSRG